MKWLFSAQYFSYAAQNWRLAWVCLALVNPFGAITVAQTLPPRPEPPVPQEPLPSEPPPLELPTAPQTPTETIPGNLQVSRIEIIGNTVISTKTLERLTLPNRSETLGDIRDQTLTFNELLAIAQRVAEYYAEQGYRTSGAVIVIPEATQAQGPGLVQVKVIEGRVGEIQVSIDNPEVLDTRFDGYVYQRLRLQEGEVLNVDFLLESLRLLQIDPQIQTLNATLAKDPQPGVSNLVVTYQPNNPFQISARIDNAQSPSVGSFQRGGSIRYNNLVGWGDKLRIAYMNFDGGDRPEVHYEIPFSTENGSVRFDYVYSSSGIIQPPFDDIDLDGQRPDITSTYEAYDVTVRQPVIREINDQAFTELGLGLNASWRNTQSFLFGEPFPFSLNADVLGNTNIFALRFNQDYLLQNPNEVLAVFSQMSLGLDAFGSSISPDLPDQPIADSNFFAWRGRAQYLKQLAPNTLWLTRSSLQLATTSLVAIEQFSVGGLGSVRGYAQNQVLADNGFFLSSEVRLPILTAPDDNNTGILQIIPFLDYGLGWNVELPTPTNNNLASVGVGVQWQLGDFSARLDYGIPLITFDRPKRDWNENGIYFTVQCGNF